MKRGREKRKQTEKSNLKNLFRIVLFFFSILNRKLTTIFAMISFQHLNLDRRNVRPQ